MFKGWYDEDGNIITKISHNANRNYTLTCQWELLKSGDPVTIYVNPEAEAHYGFSEEYGLESLEAAMETIERANCYIQNHDWIIKIKGEISGSHVISTDVNNVKEHVKSITLEGSTESVAGQTEPQDCLKGGNTTATENGAVLSVQIPIPVIIKNLKITGGNNSNTGDIKGGGIYIAEGSTVTLDDGTLITGNSADTGAGIYVEGGEFTMNGGEISGNKTDASNNGEGNGAEKSYGAGGGVFVYADGSFTMSGGEISGNSAINKKLDEEPTSTMYAYGGGVCLQASGSKLASFTMTGGTISGNTAGTSGNGIGFFGSLDTGVTGTISLGGDAIITNNDIYLPSNVTITIIESMTGGLDPEIRATITPQEYKLDQPILNNVGVTPEYEYDYFAVTPQGTTTWTINTEGKLTKATSGGSSSGSSGNDFMTVTGGEFEYDFQAGEHVGTVENDNDYDAGTLTIPDLEVCSHLVTQYEYEQLMTYYGVAQSNDALIPNETSESAKKNTPAYFVSWIDAIVYCNLRSEAEGLTPVYKIAEENSITVENSPWTQYYNVAKDSNNKYYYNSDDYNDTSSYDPDASVFSYDLSADGYRLPTTAEYQNIMSKNPDLISGGYNEWCQNYHYDYTRCMYDASEPVHKPVNNIPTITRENNLGFRVVRNADASSGSNP